MGCREASRETSKGTGLQLPLQECIPSRRVAQAGLEMEHFLLLLNLKPYCVLPQSTAQTVPTEGRLFS